MKHLFSILFLTATLSSYSQSVLKGDNLFTEFNKISTPYYFDAPNFTVWAEGENMLLIGNNPDINACNDLFLALNDTSLIGVYKTKAPSFFLFDTNGDSILNSSSELFYLPLWTVKNSAKIDSTDKTILKVLDKLYEKTMQADDLELDQETINQYQQFQTDTTLANRHIALLFDTYQSIITQTAAKGVAPPASVCIPLMKSLSEECIMLYENIPVIVCIYMGEALQSAGMTDQAREHFNLSLQFYPYSIPLLVYKHSLEQDPKKQKEQLKALKKKHSKHWMVKGL